MTSGGREFLKWLAAIFMTGDHALKILVFGYVQCPARSYIIYIMRNRVRQALHSRTRWLWLWLSSLLPSRGPSDTEIEA